MTPHTVFVCESQPLVLEGLRAVLNAGEEFQLVGETSVPAQAAEAIRDVQPELALIDYERGWREVLQFVNDVRELAPETRVVLCGAGLGGSDCYRALQAGIRGIFNRTLPTPLLLECLRQVSSGQIWVEDLIDSRWGQEGTKRPAPRLTPREKDIVRLVSQGLKNREIAERLSITAGTVKVHLMHVFEKARVKDRFQLSVRARGLLNEEPGSD